jgi:hypothetical protein
MATPKKEYPYHSNPRLVKIINNLVENFGYPKLEARQIALEVIENMDKYDKLEAIRARSLSDNQTVHRRPKTILEQRMEAKSGNVRVQVRER